MHLPEKAALLVKLRAQVARLEQEIALDLNLPGFASTQIRWTAPRRGRPLGATTKAPATAKKKRKARVKITPQLEEKVVEAYKKGDLLGVIATANNLSIAAVRNIAKRNKLPGR